MNKQDRLWKAIIEEFFEDFLKFHYPLFAQTVDMKRGFDFLEKDLPNIIPEAKEIHRKADKVAKIYLKDGTETWMIIHVEVQGYKDLNFAKRMFIYYYRLWERFGKPIASIVIYSDKNNQNRINKYEEVCLNTSLVYNFDTYVIANYSVADYEKIDNPIAIIYQVALMGMQKNLADEELLEMKVQLFRKMYEKGYEKEQIRRLATFIKKYVNFSKPDFFSKFDEATDIITNNKKNMGIIETVLEIAKEEGIEQGLEQGQHLEAFLISFEKDMDYIKSFLKMKMPIADIIKLTKYNEEFVLNLQSIISAKKYLKLNSTIKECRSKFKIYKNVNNLKSDLAQILLTNNFQEKAVSQTLKLSPKKVKTIKANLIKK